MEFQQIEIKQRSQTGKGVARKIRKEGWIPAVIYGNKSKSEAIELNPKSLTKAISSPTGRNTILQLAGEKGGSLKGRSVLLKAIQYHPVKRVLQHADLLEVDVDQAVEIEIDVNLVGKSKGVLEGGILQQVRRSLRVSCLPKKIPVSIDVDVSDLDLGESIHIGELKLAEGITALGDSKYTIATVVAPREEEEVKPAVEGVAGEEAVAAEGEAVAAGEEKKEENAGEAKAEPAKKEEGGEKK